VRYSLIKEERFLDGDRRPCNNSWRPCAPSRSWWQHSAEISASQADNEELRKTNEELRRDLQQAGECAVDERAPPVPPKSCPMTFSQAIMDTAFPTTSLGPKVTFTGEEDPEAHLTAFHTQMMLTGGSDAVYRKLLMSTLADVVL